MIALAAMAMAGTLAHAPTPDYVPAGGGVTVCEEPQLLIAVRLSEEVHAGQVLGDDARSKGRCTTILQNTRVYVDFVEEVPWRLGDSQTTGIAKVVRGRMRQQTGVDLYFYGMAADFHYFPPRP